MVTTENVCQSTVSTTWSVTWENGFMITAEKTEFFSAALMGAYTLRINLAVATQP